MAFVGGNDGQNTPPDQMCRVWALRDLGAETCPRLIRTGATMTSGSEADYRGWTVSQGRWPEPAWSATGPNYDASWEGEEDGWVASGGHVDAPTRDALVVEIDAWIEEHSDDAAVS